MSTNRKWQNHLTSKGPIAFFLDRLQAHALSSAWQYEKGPFYFPIDNRDNDDELSKAYFQMTERFPYEIYLELTNTCNLQCKMCARTQMKRPNGFMSQELFVKLINEIAIRQPYAYLHYYGIGEPLLDKGLWEKLHYARKKGLVNSILFTNGQLLLKGDTIPRLARSGVAVIGVDLDGFTEKSYSSVRVGGDFEKAKQGIAELYKYIRENHLTTRVEIAYQIYPGINEIEVDPFVKWCGQNEYEYKLVTMHSWAGMRSDVPKTEMPGLIDPHHQVRSGACSSLWSGFVVGWDGRVAQCFQDADFQQCLGDVNIRTIEEIWTTSHLAERQRHLSGQFTGICANCDSNTEVVMPTAGSRLYPDSYLT